MAARSSRSSISSAAKAVAAIFIVIAAIVGCGGLGITGGSVPVGTITFRGTVITAGGQPTVVPAAPITLTYTPTRATGPGTGGGGSGGSGSGGTGGIGGGGSSSLQSGANGEFDYGVIGAGSYVIEVTPPVGSGLGSGYTWGFGLPTGSGSAQMLARLWPADFDPTTVASVALSPATTSIHVGQSIQYIPLAFGQAGGFLSAQPSLLIIGNVGDLTLDGTVHATSVGRARIIAWMHGRSASADLFVSP